MLNIPGPWPNGGAFQEISLKPEELRGRIRRKDAEFTEEFLLRVLGEPRNQAEVYWAAIALRSVGTAASIPTLKELCKSRKQDIAAVALLTIASIAGQLETDFYIDALTGNWYRQRGYALWAIEVTADPKALPTVLKWLKANRSRIRNGKLHHQDAFHAAAYLFRLSPELPEAAAALKELAPDVWSLWRSSGFSQYRGYEAFLDFLEKEPTQGLTTTFDRNAVADDGKGRDESGPLQLT